MTERRRKQLRRVRWIMSKYAGEHRHELLLISAIAVVSAAANGLAPLLVGRFIDAILAPQEIEFLGFNLAIWMLLLGGWLGIQLVAAGADWLVRRRGGRLSSWLATTYISRGFATLLRLPLSFHKRKQSGNSASLVHRGGMYMETLLRITMNIAPQLLSIVVGIGIALFISVWASLPLLIGVGIYLLLLRRNFGQAAHMRKKHWQHFNSAFGTSYDMINNVESVKHFTAEPYASGLFGRKFRRAFRWDYGGILIWSRINLQQKLLVVSVQLAVFIISVLLIQAGDMTIGELIALNGYAAMFFGPFVALGQQIDRLQEALIGLDKAEKVLTARPETYTPSRAIKPANIAGEVQFREVTFGYQPKDGPVLHDINLHIRPGKTLALVGESGVGKSTLVDLIGGFYFPRKGTVLIDGHNIRRLDLDFVRRHISYIPQDILLFHETIYNNIRFAKPTAGKAEVEEAARLAGAHDFIQRFSKGYNAIVGERGIKLSTGQRQRIAIARVILRDPSILILDEPTSALDAKTERTLTDSLEELMAGRTTIIVAHRLSTVRRADTIAALKNGHIQELGSHQELLEKESGIYRELHDLQFDIT